MTTIVREKSICAVCGSEEEFPVIVSTNTFFGSADLDTRPPEMMRSTIFTWVQQCPICGYCASNIGKRHPEAKNVIENEKYKRQLKDRKYPQLANSFICMSMFAEQTGSYVTATWDLIHAAWVCDDSKNPDAAIICRNKAVEMLLTAEKHIKELTSQKAVMTAILVDLLRRSGRFEEAGKIIAQRRAEISEEIIITILDFQSAIIEQGDVSCHTISEAVKNKKGGAL